MKRQIAAAVLIVGPMALVPSEARSDTVPAGTRARVVAAESFTIPGIAVVRRGRAEGRFETHDAETATARDADGRLLTLPLPDTEIFGTLASVDETTVSLVRADGQGPMVIPRAAVGYLYVQRSPKKKAVAKGILLGFLGGLAVGTTYGILGHPPFEHAYESSVLQEAMGYGVLFSIPGAAMGGMTGVGRDGGWREVPLNGVEVGLGSDGRSAGVRVSVRW
jgi:hypothetical protein